METTSHPVRRILVPIDFSSASEAALEYASFLAAEYGAAVDVLHAWKPRRSGTSTLAQFAVSHAGHRMQELLSSLEAQGIVQVRGRLEKGPPAEAILDAAERDEYDLIIVGTHCSARFHHLLTGSVAEKIVRGARCPVLTVRAAEVGTGATS